MAEQSAWCGTCHVSMNQVTTVATAASRSAHDDHYVPDKCVLRELAIDGIMVLIQRGRTRQGPWDTLRTGQQSGRHVVQLLSEVQ